jgi:hypothetical protein
VALGILAWPDSVDNAGPVDSGLIQVNTGATTPAYAAGHRIPVKISSLGLYEEAGREIADSRHTQVSQKRQSG